MPVRNFGEVNTAMGSMAKYGPFHTSPAVRWWICSRCGAKNLNQESWQGRKDNRPLCDTCWERQNYRQASEFLIAVAGACYAWTIRCSTCNSLLDYDENGIEHCRETHPEERKQRLMNWQIWLAIAIMLISLCTLVFCLQSSNDSAAKNNEIQVGIITKQKEESYQNCLAFFYAAEGKGTVQVVDATNFCGPLVYNTP